MLSKWKKDTLIVFHQNYCINGKPFCHVRPIIWCHPFSVIACLALFMSCLGWRVRNYNSYCICESAKATLSVMSRAHIYVYISWSPSRHFYYLILPLHCEELIRMMSFVPRQSLLKCLLYIIWGSERWCLHMLLLLRGGYSYYIPMTTRLSFTMPYFDARRWLMRQFFICLEVVPRLPYIAYLSWGGSWSLYPWDGLVTLMFHKADPCTSPVVLWNLCLPRDVVPRGDLLRTVHFSLLTS